MEFMNMKYRVSYFKQTWNTMFPFWTKKVPRKCYNDVASSWAHFFSGFILFILASSAFPHPIFLVVVSPFLSQAPLQKMHSSNSFFVQGLYCIPPNVQPKPMSCIIMGRSRRRSECAEIPLAKDELDWLVSAIWLSTGNLIDETI